MINPIVILANAGTQANQQSPEGVHIESKADHRIRDGIIFVLGPRIREDDKGGGAMCEVRQIP